MKKQKLSTIQTQSKPAKQVISKAQTKCLKGGDIVIVEDIIG